jgi:hypothetical protein
MHISFSHKQLVNSKCAKFLGLNIDKKLSWKNHIDYRHINKFVMFHNENYTY